MDPQQWLDEVRNELQTRQLPRRYVTRLLRELSDHVLDGWERTMNKDVRVFAGPHDQLGSPGQIADTAEKKFQSRRFAARFPLLTFGLLPVLAFPFVAAAMFTGPGWVIVTILDALELDDSLMIPDESKWSEWLPAIARSYTAAAIILAAGLVVWTASRLARRAGLTAKWPMISAVLVALIAGCIWSDAGPKTPEKPGMLMVGFAYPLHAWTIFQSTQLIAPLTLAAWLARPSTSTSTTPVAMARAA